MKKIFLIISFHILFLHASTLANCWDIKERSLINGFSQLDGRYIFSLKDAKSCDPIKNAKLLVKDRTYKSNSEGYFILDITDLDLGFDEHVKMSFKKDGYIQLDELINFELEIPRQTQFLMSEGIAFDSLRIVLQWSNKPIDLDLHLQCQSFHVSYRNKRNAEQQANLDRDDRNGFGPETITYFKFKNDETCQIYVHNYSNEIAFTGEELIYFYAENKLKKKMRIKNYFDRKALIATIENGALTFSTQ